MADDTRARAERAKPGGGFTIDDLWRIERLAAPSLSPDGTRAVLTLTRYDMQDNRASTSLVLLSLQGSLQGGAPRMLTSCGDKDGGPAWGPLRADGRPAPIAFLARREQHGKKDLETQIYLIDADGGEARRASDWAPGVAGGLRWFPDGRHLAFVSWVYVAAKPTAQAQATSHKAAKERKESGYVTDQAVYRHWDHNLPMGRRPHLCVLDTETGKVVDLLAESGFELPLFDPENGSFDIAPDGRSLVFCHDPADDKRIMNCHALAVVQLAKPDARGRLGRVKAVRRLWQAEGWHVEQPRFSHGGTRIALVAQQRARRHNAPLQLALLAADGSGFAIETEAWDREISGAIRWSDADDAVIFAAEDEGRCHLWRWDLAARAARQLAAGGWVHGFDARAGQIVYCADSMVHPARAYAMPADAAAPPRRIERYNDELLARFSFGRHESVQFDGARAAGRPTQMWLVYPPGFDPRRRYPVLHSIHGGPHTASGDTWHYRWNNQVFASGNGGPQQYIVCCVNYHGSTSFGDAYKCAIDARWGEHELADIEAATDWLRAQPYVDPQRIFAAGGSYGGYLVAWMNGHCAPGRYRAYVCHAGCYDWVAMFASDGADYFKHELGAWYWERDDRGRAVGMQKVHAQSPHAYAHAFSTPTLVVHGLLDYRVPDAQGLAYYNTLKAQGVPARLLWYPDENHWVLKPRNSRLWYEEFFGWLTRHDAPPERAGGKGQRRKHAAGANAGKARRGA
jgi:dipeptidyl aminopeptidase/acylaminoacyl peptidase